MVSSISFSRAFHFYFCFFVGELDEMLPKKGEYLGYEDNSNGDIEALRDHFL